MQEAQPKHGGYEFWQPPRSEAREAALPDPIQMPVRPRPEEVCARCRTEFVLGSRFCHVCGAQRSAPKTGLVARLQQLADLDRLRAALGLTLASLIAFLLGIACLGAAVGTGLVFSVITLTDWQAIQMWRIQWLLGAAVAFLAGILLKR